MIRKLYFTFLLAVCILPGIASAAQASGFAHILPDVVRHVEFARSSIEDKNWNRAIAHTDLVVFTRPIKVVVDYDHRSADRRAECLESLNQAFGFWSEQLNNGVQFQIVESAADADLNVVFQPQAINRGRHVGGNINWRRSVRIRGNDISAAMHANITVSTEAPNRCEMSFEAMRHAITHELGHVLGLDDSEKIGDIMGPIRLDRPSFSLMPYERDALLSLREQVLELRTEALNATFMNLMSIH